MFCFVFSIFKPPNGRRVFQILEIALQKFSQILNSSIYAASYKKKKKNSSIYFHSLKVDEE